MRKITIIGFLFFFMLISVGVSSHSNKVNAQLVIRQPNKYHVYHDETVNLLSPYVQEAINSHYQFKDSLSQELYTTPAAMRIVKVKRIGKVENEEYLITIATTGYSEKDRKVPVVDAQITFRVKGPMTGTLEKRVYFEGFKQTKLYKFPQN